MSKKSIYQPTLKSEFRTEALFQSFTPCASLSPFVFEYWIMDLHSKAKHDKGELQLPSVYPEVIFKFGVDYQIKYLHTNKKQIQSKSSISGICNFAKESKRTQLDENLFMVGIKFHPFGLYTLLNIPLSELYNQITSIHNISNTFLSQLEEKLFSSKNRTEIIKTLDQELSNLFSQINISPESLNFYKNICPLNPSIKNKALSTKQYNYKYLERSFKKYLGINPKKLFKLLRFQSFYDDWLISDNYKYIDLVYKYDYYDQNHLIKDFKSVLKQSPNKYKKTMDDLFTQHINMAKLNTLP